MALDKLVDSTKLDACLDAEADAIRAKTGGSADIPFDFANNKGFADAIAAIPSGGGGWELIAEATTDEDVEAFRVDIPAAKQNMAAYIVEYDCRLLAGTGSVALFPCPRLNSISQGTPYTPQSSTAKYSLGIARACNGGYKMVLIPGSGGVWPQNSSVSAVKYVAMLAYYAGNLVAAGSTIKVYGIGEPT